MLGNVTIEHGRVLVDNKITTNPMVIGLAILDAAEDKPENEFYQKNKTRLSNFIKKNNYRHTIERFEVLKATHDFKKDFTITNIHSSMEEQKRFVSLSVVYKTIKVLIDAKIIEKVIDKNSKNYSTKYRLCNGTN